MNKSQSAIQKRQSSISDQSDLKLKQAAISSVVKNIQAQEKKDMERFSITDQEVKEQLLETCNPKRKMKGVSETVKKNDGVLVLDGGMITGMEELGANLYGAYNLWYPQFIDNEPGLIEKTHQKYYSSGADIVMSATYNSRVKYSRYLNKGIELAANARNNLKKDGVKRELLIAAAQGPYGSGAIQSLEYDGSYGKEISQAFLEQEHRIKFTQFVNNEEVDIIAFETIPNLKEVKVILNLIKSHPGVKAWIAVSCKNEHQLVSGDSFKEFVKLVEKSDKAGQVEAIGVNCSHPKFTTSLIQTMRSMTKRILIVYPNNGGHFDAKCFKWVNDGMDTPESFAEEALKWKQHGNPIIIGGCCKTYFKWIEELANKLKNKNTDTTIEIENQNTASTDKASTQSSHQKLGKKRGKQNTDDLFNFMPKAKMAKLE